MAKQSNEDLLKGLFKAIDADGSGAITADEILTVLNNPKANQTKKYSKAEVEGMIKAIDKSGDGKVDIKEFLDFFKSNK